MRYYFVNRISLLLLSLLALFSSNQTLYAEFYRCTVNGKTVFSDEPCGNKAEKIEIEQPTPSSGTRLDNQKMKDLGDSLSRDRRQRELERSIDRQHQTIERIRDNYDKKNIEIERKLSDLEADAQRNNWKRHPDKKKKIRTE